MPQFPEVPVWSTSLSELTFKKKPVVIWTKVSLPSYSTTLREMPLFELLNVKGTYMCANNED